MSTVQITLRISQVTLFMMGSINHENVCTQRAVSLWRLPNGEVPMSVVQESSGKRLSLIKAPANISCRGNLGEGDNDVQRAASPRIERAC